MAVSNSDRGSDDDGDVGCDGYGRRDTGGADDGGEDWGGDGGSGGSDGVCNDRSNGGDGDSRQ